MNQSRLLRKSHFIYCRKGGRGALLGIIDVKLIGVEDVEIYDRIEVTDK